MLQAIRPTYAVRPKQIQSTYAVRPKQIQYVDGPPPLESGDHFEPVDGIYKSRLLSGLWFDAAAYWRGDLARLIAMVQDGVNSAEHGEFVQRLEVAANG